MDHAFLIAHGRQDGAVQAGESVPADGIPYNVSWKTMVYSEDTKEVTTLAALAKLKGATCIWAYKPFPAGGVKADLELKFQSLV